MEQFSFEKSECLLQYVSGDNSNHYFRQLLTEHILDKVIAQTNNYAYTVFCSRERKQHSRINLSKETKRDG